MELIDKLEILSDSAKYDVSCASSGADRPGEKGMLGNTNPAGICHSFTPDGRCVSLLKVLLSNNCIYNCQYCVNRQSGDVRRATFTARELAELTIGFYRRNYIEGLFLSSAVFRSPDYTMEQMCAVVRLLREEYGFRGYIHGKAIPGASRELVARLGSLCDRISVNLELPSEQSLNLLAPDKPRRNIFRPMGQIRDHIEENRHDLVAYRHTPQFAPAGQSTQMIIGATPETDYQIVRLAQSLYRKYALKRVYYSAYIPVGSSALLPVGAPVPLLREHRLYQADWLVRVYGFGADEILSAEKPHLDPLLDPKCNWALAHLDQFPVEVNKADLDLLLRVPGIGPACARKIITARRNGALTFESLKKLRVVLKRAAYFVTCSGKMMEGVRLEYTFIYHNLTTDTRRRPGALPFGAQGEQLSLFQHPRALPPALEEVQKCLTGQF